MSSDSSRETAVADVPDAGDRGPTEGGVGVEDRPEGSRGAESTEGLEDTAESQDAADTDTDVADGAEAVDTDETEDAVDGDAVGEDEADAQEGAAGSGRRREVLPKRLVLGSAALALAAFIVAAVFGVLWFVTATGDRAELAAARQSVIKSARVAVQAVTELDHRHLDRYFEQSKAVSTDQFAKSLASTEKALRDMLKKTKTTVETTVLDIGVQELNNHEGTATFLAVIETHVSAQGRENTKVMRLKGTMERVAEGGEKVWKLSGLGAVPVVTSPAVQGQSGQDSGSGTKQDTSKSKSKSGDSSKGSGK